MGTKETAISNQIRLHASSRGVVLFTNPAGCGKINGQFVTYGLTPGSSDLIGWVPVTITPDMVGRQIAVFTGVEVKTLTGKAQENQKIFRNNVRRAGGIACIANSPKALDFALDDLIGDHKEHSLAPCIDCGWVAVDPADKNISGGLCAPCYKRRQEQ